MEYLTFNCACCVISVGRVSWKREWRNLAVLRGGIHLEANT